MTHDVTSEPPPVETVERVGAPATLHRLPPTLGGAAGRVLTTARLVAVAVAGAGTALAGALLLVAGSLTVLAAGLPRLRASVVVRVRRGACALTALDRRRLALVRGPDPLLLRHRRPFTYLLVRSVTGTLGGAVVAAGALIGLAYTTWSVVLIGQGRLPALTAAVSVGLGLVAVYLAVQFAGALDVWDRYLGRRLLAPDARGALQQRVTELTISRADVVEAVDDERRRIERDLHDGVQQRLVALSMLLGRARRSADADVAAQLHERAHDEAQAVLQDLREVAWRIYPTVLDDAGLRAAVETVAERCHLPVRVHFNGDAQGPRPVQTAAYFVVCEAVTNAAKHAGATTVQVDVTRLPEALRVQVTDDGVGGADPHGGGLSGLARRATAIDGRLWIHSPAGGPTTITAELPCA